MKKLIYTLLIIIVGLISSCDGFEISHNGDLDGMWHLVKVDSIQSGVNKSVDYTQEGIYWSFQDDLMYVDDKLQRYQSLYLRFKLDNNQLVTSNPYINHHREQAEEPTTDVTLLSPYGINAIPQAFSVEKLNSDDMILMSSLVRLTFVKY